MCRGLAKPLTFQPSSLLTSDSCLLYSVFCLLPSLHQPPFHSNASSLSRPVYMIFVSPSRYTSSSTYARSTSPPLVSTFTGLSINPFSFKMTPDATTPVPHAYVSPSTPLSYVLTIMLALSTTFTKSTFVPFSPKAA